MKKLNKTQAITLFRLWLSLCNASSAKSVKVLYVESPDEREKKFINRREECVSESNHAATANQMAVRSETVDTTNDDAVIQSILEGNQDAFELLVRRYSPRVFSIIGSFFRRRDMVEDIAQEVFARSYFSLSTFTLGRSFEAWVAKITVNACYDHLRAQRRRSENSAPQYTEQEDEWLELQMLEAARDRHASFERQREASDIAERLLSKLDPDDRIVLVLLDRDGFSVQEIAEMLGWGQSKIKVRAFRARRALRSAMKRLILSAENKQKKKQMTGSLRQWSNRTE